MKNGKLLANSLPSTKSSSQKYLRKVASLINEEYDINLQEHEITSLIFEIDENPKDKWAKSINLEIDYSLFSGKQKDVLMALRKIKSGRVLSYAELAEKSGITNGARFVGNCMAKNSMPLIIPCHRVINSDGSLGNYSGDGGKQRKKVYLEKESIDII